MFQKELFESLATDDFVLLSYKDVYTHYEIIFQFKKEKYGFVELLIEQKNDGGSMYYYSGIQDKEKGKEIEAKILEIVKNEKVEILSFPFSPLGEKKKAKASLIKEKILYPILLFGAFNGALLGDGFSMRDVYAVYMFTFLTISLFTYYVFESKFFNKPTSTQRVLSSLYWMTLSFLLSVMYAICTVFL